MKHHYQQTQLSRSKTRTLAKSSKQYPVQPEPSERTLLGEATDSCFFNFTEPVLTPWTEVVGTISKVDNDSVLLECRTCLRLGFPETVVRRYKRLLKKDNAIGILMTDRGDFRIRPVNGS